VAGKEASISFGGNAERRYLSVILPVLIFQAKGFFEGCCETVPRTLVELEVGTIDFKG